MTVVFACLLGFWGCLDIYVFFFRNRKGNRNLQERKSKYLLLVSMCIGLALAMFLDSGWEFFLGPFRLTGYVGMFLVLSGIVLKLSAMKELGEGYLIDVGLLPGKEFCKKGIYSVIRHPGYSADLLALSGIAFFISRPLNAFLILSIPFVGFFIRARIEEEYLKRVSGKGYREYFSKTKRFIPFIF